LSSHYTDGHCQAVVAPTHSNSSISTAVINAADLIPAAVNDGDCIVAYAIALLAVESSGVAHWQWPGQRLALMR